MGRRAKQSIPDSLELLLDTMCNTFGGIMFIAIALLVICSSIPQIVVNLAEQSQTQSTVDSFIKQLEAEITQIKNRRMSIESHLQDKEKPKSDTIESTKLIDENATLNKQKADLEGQLAKIKQELLDRYAKQSTAVDDLKTSEEERKKTIKELKKIKEELDSAIKKMIEETSKVDRLTLSFSKFQTSGGKNTNIMVLKAGKLYVHPDDLETTKPYPGTMAFKPLPGKGLMVDKTAKTSNLLSALLKKMSGRNAYPLFLVANDSFQEFIIIRKIIKDEKINFDWGPITNDEFIVSFGEGRFQ